MTDPRRDNGELDRHVLVATDERFAPATAVTLRSISMHLRSPFTATVLHDAVSASSRERVERSLDDHVTVRWIDASSFNVDATTPSHLPTATYFRLQVADALPSEAKRVIYLDVDMIVRRSLEPLFTADLQGRALGAVRSVHYPHLGTRGACDDWRVLDLDPRAPFFNAGLLIIDLARWRDARISERALEYLRSEHCGRGADQEALNVALHGQWHEFEPEWNQQTPLLSDTFGAHLIHTVDEIDRARNDPAIVHYLMRPKPWQKNCTHPYAHEWWEIADRTAFAPIEKTAVRSASEEWHWRIKRAASALVKGR